MAHAARFLSDRLTTATARGCHLAARGTFSRAAIVFTAVRGPPKPAIRP